MSWLKLLKITDKCTHIAKHAVVVEATRNIYREQMHAASSRFEVILARAVESNALATRLYTYNTTGHVTSISEGVSRFTCVSH